ncbi:hypothetical protein EYF80_000472 [Liparis tanakae]|uniref:Uncharacterized protein n=1 Tax=Liparis tanakae TaxID=230148 RepID=A0A4Z2JHG2_9TELE|nr:hypothetical protein EYF80_000472 [Liparis tanakae]
MGEDSVVVVLNGPPVPGLSARQPAMWSLSTLIKLSVVPNSNQKDTTSVPDSISRCQDLCIGTRSSNGVEESAKAQEEQQGKHKYKRQRGDKDGSTVDGGFKCCSD